MNLDRKFSQRKKILHKLQSNLKSCEYVGAKKSLTSINEIYFLHRVREEINKTTSKKLFKGAFWFTFWKLFTTDKSKKTNKALAHGSCGFGMTFPLFTKAVGSNFFHSCTGRQPRRKLPYKSMTNRCEM